MRARLKVTLAGFATMLLVLAGTHRTLSGD